MACVPREDSDQPGHSASLIRVFAVRMKKACGSLATRWAHNEDSDQTGQMPSWSESSVGAQSFVWFCHEAAQMLLLLESASLRLFKNYVTHFIPSQVLDGTITGYPTEIDHPKADLCWAGFEPTAVRDQTIERQPTQALGGHTGRLPVMKDSHVFNFMNATIEFVNITDKNVLVIILNLWIPDLTRPIEMTIFLISSETLSYVTNGLDIT